MMCHIKVVHTILAQNTTSAPARLLLQLDHEWSAGQHAVAAPVIEIRLGAREHLLGKCGPNIHATERGVSEMGTLCA